MATVYKNSVRNNQVINDFGQKIGGAHKDRAREAAAALYGVDASALMLKPLSKVAKLPDLRALYLAGAITQEAARRAWWLWSQIGPKPAGSRPWRVRDWAQAAAGIIQAVADILAYGDSQKSQLPDGAREYQPADLFDEEMNAANWPAEDYKRGAYFVGRHWMGRGFSIHSHKSSYNKGFESVAACVDAIREKVGSNADRTPVAADFDIYKTRATGVYFVAPKSKPGIKLMQFDDFDAAYNYRREHPEALAERLADLRNLPAERHDWNRPRVGADYRNGKDLTPEAFADAFPFRGVEFGNWVTQLERAANLNECADALRDMAAVIGIKPEAVALGGSLAWAFGSRGVGRAQAHYETGRRVINLTKKKGNGCVAHEWFHALDNYLMIQAGKPSLFMVADSRAYGNCEKSQLYTAAADLRCALQRSEMYTRSKRIDELKGKPYWATTTEMAARAFEAYILYKLEAAGICNDYLVSITPESDYSRSECYPYPTREEAAQLAPLFDAFLLAAFSEADRVSEQAAEQAADGAAYGDGEKSQISENLPTSIKEWETSALRDEVEQIARELGFIPSRYCPSTLFFLRDKDGKPELNSKGEALTVSMCPSYPAGLNAMPAMWHRKGYINRVLSSYWSVGVEASTKEYSAGKFNPTEKPDPEGRRMVINFDWMLEATADNFRRIMEEILRRFRHQEVATI